MKEKISCSLDGDLIDRLDDVIESYPTISNRSAMIETACVMFIDCYDFWDSFDLDRRITFCHESNKRDEFIRREFERRCEWNAQKESKN